MGVKLVASSGGSVELVPTNTASNFTVTVPAVTASMLTDSSGVMNIGSGQIYKDSSGNVGIGTSSPTEKVTSSNGFLSTGAVSSTARDGALVDYTASVSRFIAGRSGGNYGQWEAHVAGASGVTKRYQIDYDSTYHWYAADGTTERMRIDSSGNLLIGTTSGTGARMDVVAADEVVSFNRSAATDGVVQRWRKAGSTVGYVSTNTYSLPSDERVKTNIVNIGYGLDFINSLRPVQYNTIFQDPENATQKNFGLIAQEVEQALADIGKSVDDVTFLEKFVPENDTESRYGLGYQNLVPVLIKAIQEQQAIITSLTDRITALENK